MYLIQAENEGRKLGAIDDHTPARYKTIQQSPIHQSKEINIVRIHVKSERYIREIRYGGGYRDQVRREPTLTPVK